MVYLDQNKWIDLASAYHGKTGGERFNPALLAVQNAVQQKRARFPLSSVHVIETMKMGDRARRERLATVMAEISEGWAIAPAEKVNADELKVAVPTVLGKALAITQPLVFGRGIEFAFRQPISAGELIAALDSPDEGKKDLAIHFLGLILQSEEGLRKPEIDRYNDSMNSLAAEFDRIRNLVISNSKHKKERAFTARYMIEYFADHKDELTAALAATGVRMEVFLRYFQKQEDFRKFFAEMATSDVAIALRNQRNMQYQKVIEANDLNDLSFLSVAIPYCDVVVTEKQWVDLAKRARLDQEYHTALISDLTELAHHL